MLSLFLVIIFLLFFLLYLKLVLVLCQRVCDLRLRLLTLSARFFVSGVVLV